MTSAPANSGQNVFTALAALGYPATVPIIPPGASVSPRSTLAKRIDTPSDGRGKSPGIRHRDGLWSGFDWLPYRADARDYERWHDMGAGTGIKTGAESGVVVLDADTENEEYAGVIKGVIERVCGLSPVRIGKYPKSLYVFRTEAGGVVPQYRRVEFGKVNGKGVPERVELLSDGRQFVAAGVHNRTGLPYRWARALCAWGDLPVLTEAQAGRVMTELTAVLPLADIKTEGGGAEVVDQGTLLGEPSAIARAVRALPNTDESHPSREDYLGVGYAIKAALGPDRISEGFDLWAEWCERWTGGTNDLEVMEADWRRMKGPFKRGASWLYEEAERLSNGGFTRADAWFDALPDEGVTSVSSTGDGKKRYRLTTLDDLETRPPARWLVARHVPAVGVGFLYSEPGIGKTFLALDLACHVACGDPAWHGDTIARDAERPAVIYIAGEGGYGFRARIAAWRARNDAGRDTERGRALGANLVLIEETVNFMKPDDIGAVLRSVREAGLRPCLIVVDTVSRALPGADENLQKDMTLFVTACDALRDAWSCAVLGVHHAGKSGDMRGSTVLRGAGDFVFRLSRRKGSNVGLLECEKQKDGPDQWEDSYAFSTVVVGAGETSLVVSRMAAPQGEAGVTPARTAEIMSAMRAAWDAGDPWSKNARAGERFAIRRMAADFGIKASDSEMLLKVWEDSGLITTVMQSSKNKRSGYRVEGARGQNVGLTEAFG